jgi:predicted nucleic acid-binding protein
MYAAGTPHRYKEACVRILSHMERGRMQAAIDTELIQEMLYRYSHIGLAEKGIELSRQIFEYPLIILPVTSADMHLAIDLYDRHRTAGIRPRDAVHAAVARNNGILEVLSSDTDFDHFGFLNRIDPVTYAASL